MAYTSGMLKYRIKVLNRKEGESSQWGLDGAGIEWEDCGCFWAAVDHVKGIHAMREGAIDVYGVVMVRMRYNKVVNMRSRIQYEGQTYQILGETFHAEFEDNTIQFNAQILINEN